MKITLFDGPHHKKMLPLTFTKPVCELRVGIKTIREKWNHYASDPVQVRTQPYLNDLFKGNDNGGGIGISGAVIPNDDLVMEIMDMPEKSFLLKENQLVAINPFPSKEDNPDEFLANFKKIEVESEVSFVNNVWDIFKLNDQEIRSDLEIIKEKAIFGKPSPTNSIIGDEVFIEKGAKVECAILNSTNGPIYVAEGAEIMEGSVVRGALAMCRGSVLKLSSKIYGATTLGPYSKVGGEVNNSVIQGYSNKGHDGFLGNSVIGEWCNLGADTNNSNLKNNYGEIKVWSYADEDYINSTLQFCGLIMGDHSKCGINTMLNTGTVVGVNANIFGGGFPPKFVPSYSWGNEGKGTYNYEKSLEVAERVMERRNVALTNKYKEVLKHVFEESKKYRS